MTNLIRSFLFAFLFITLAFSSVFVHINIVASADSESQVPMNPMSDLVAARDEARKLVAQMKIEGKDRAIVTIHGDRAESSKENLSQEFKVFLGVLRSSGIEVDFRRGEGPESVALVQGAGFLVKVLNESLTQIDQAISNSEASRAIFSQVFQHAKLDMETMADGASRDTLERQFERLIGSMNDYVVQIESISPGFQMAQGYLKNIINAQTESDTARESERFQRFLGETETMRNTVLEVLYKRLQTLRAGIQAERTPEKVYEFSERLMEYLRISRELGGVDPKALAVGLVGSGELQPPFLFGDLFEGTPSAKEFKERAKLTLRLLNGHRTDIQGYNVSGSSGSDFRRKIENGKVRVLQTLGVPNGLDWSMYRKAITDKGFKITKREIALAAVNTGTTMLLIYFGLDLQAAKGVLVDPMVGALIGGATKFAMELFNRANGVFMVQGSNFSANKGYQLNQILNYGTRFTHSLFLGLVTLSSPQIPKQGSVFFDPEHIEQILKISIMNSLLGVFAKAPIKTYIDSRIQKPEGSVSDPEAMSRKKTIALNFAFDTFYQMIKTSALLGFTFLPMSQVFIGMGITGAGFQLAGHLKGGTQIPIFQKQALKDLLTQIIMFRPYEVINPAYKAVAAETLREDYQSLKNLANKPVNFVKEKLAPSAGASISCQKLLSSPRISLSY